MRRILLISCSSVALVLAASAPAAAQVTMSPREADFGKQTVDTESAPKQFTLSNSPPFGVMGGFETDPYVGAGFRIVSHTCPSTLAYDTSCTISVVFAPGLPGRTGTTLFARRGLTGGSSADLSGEGIAGANKKRKSKKCKKGKKGAAAAKKKGCKNKKR